jgi:hypothetical protein
MTWNISSNVPKQVIVLVVVMQANPALGTMQPLIITGRFDAVLLQLHWVIRIQKGVKDSSLLPG